MPHIHTQIIKEGIKEIAKGTMALVGPEIIDHVYEQTEGIVQEVAKSLDTYGFQEIEDFPEFNADASTDSEIEKIQKYILDHQINLNRKDINIIFTVINRLKEISKLKDYKKIVKHDERVELFSLLFPNLDKKHSNDLYISFKTLFELVHTSPKAKKIIKKVDRSGQLFPILK